MKGPCIRNDEPAYVTGAVQFCFMIPIQVRIKERRLPLIVPAIEPMCPLLNSPENALADTACNVIPPCHCPTVQLASQSQLPSSDAAVTCFGGIERVRGGGRRSAGADCPLPEIDFSVLPMLPPMLPDCACARQGTENIPTANTHKTKRCTGLSPLTWFRRQLLRAPDAFTISPNLPILFDLSGDDRSCASLAASKRRDSSPAGAVSRSRPASRNRSHRRPIH